MDHANNRKIVKHVVLLEEMNEFTTRMYLGIQNALRLSLFCNSIFQNYTYLMQNLFFSTRILI